MSCGAGYGLWSERPAPRLLSFRYRDFTAPTPRSGRVRDGEHGDVNVICAPLARLVRLANPDGSIWCLPPLDRSLYNLPMSDAEAPEFSLRSPLASALAVIRAVLFSPRIFYLNFSAEGPVREPAIFVLLVGAVTGLLTAAVAILSGLLFGE